jgi:ribonuclease P protein subunit POP4
VITPYNILRHELIGLKCTAETAGKTHEGTITGETKNTITLRDSRGLAKKIIKKEAKLLLTLDQDAKVQVGGSLLAERPEDRIKKKIRIRY